MVKNGNEIGDIEEQTKMLQFCMQYACKETKTFMQNILESFSNYVIYCLQIVICTPGLS